MRRAVRGTDLTRRGLLRLRRWSSRLPGSRTRTAAAQPGAPAAWRFYVARAAAFPSLRSPRALQLGARDRFAVGSWIAGARHGSSNAAIDGARAGVNGRYQSSFLDIARFALLGLITSPFALWISIYSYSFYDRVSISAMHLKAHSQRNVDTECFGNEQLKEKLVSLTSKRPKKIVVVAGTNEVGKSTVLRHVLQKRDPVTWVSLMTSTDSLSGLTQHVSRALGCWWLELRSVMVNILPFAGSEVLVLKERFSVQDLTEALDVACDALRLIANTTEPGQEPVIVIEDLGEGGNGWLESPDGQLALKILLNWAVLVAKEEHLAHVIISGSERLIFELVEEYRETRGNISFVGVSMISREKAGEFLRSHMEGIEDQEVNQLIDVFGGCVHDLISVCSDFQSQLQGGVPRPQALDTAISKRTLLFCERIGNAFAVSERAVHAGVGDGHELEAGEGSSDGGDGAAATPLKQLQDSYSSMVDDTVRRQDVDRRGSMAQVTYTPLQLWHTLRKIVRHPQVAVPFSELRDSIFGGNAEPILELIRQDILGFKLGDDSAGSFWVVTPATPALGLAFKQMLQYNTLGVRMHKLERLEAVSEELRRLSEQRSELLRRSQHIENMKSSIASTIDLADKMSMRSSAHSKLTSNFEAVTARQAETLRLLADVELQLSELTDQRQEMSLFLADTGHRQLKLAMLEILNRLDPGSTDLAHMDAEQVRSLFDELDMSNTGVLTATDFRNALEDVMHSKVDKEIIEHLVKAFDKDNDGHIDFDEFLDIINGVRADATTHVARTTSARVSSSKSEHSMFTSASGSSVAAARGDTAARSGTEDALMRLRELEGELEALKVAVKQRREPS